MTTKAASLRRCRPVAVAEPQHHITFLSVDYAPAKVGDKIFWLPTNVSARGANGKTPFAWVSRYSDYHQFTASVILLPGAAEQEASQTSNP